MLQLYSRIARHFPIPPIIEMKYAGIHISSSNVITYLDCERKGTDLIPLHAEKVSFIRTNEDDTTDLLKKLTYLHDKYKINFVKVTIPESKSYLYETDIPAVTDADMDDTVAFTIEEKAPVSLSQVVFGYRITDDSKPDTKTVSVSVVPNDVVTMYVDLFRKAGMYPLTFKVEAQAVANAVVPIGSKENIIIATVKDNKTVIAIVQSGGVFMSTTVDMGGAAFNAALHQCIPDASAEEVEEKKYKDNFIERGEKDPVSSAFLEQCTLFKNYLNKYYVYWLTHKAATNDHAEKLSKIIVIGKEASIPGFIEYLGSNLKVPVEAGNVWTNCFDVKEHVPQISYRDSFDYAEAVGLLVEREQ